jgi:hypothetical protein
LLDVDSRQDAFAGNSMESFQSNNDWYLASLTNQTKSRVGAFSKIDIL